MKKILVLSLMISSIFPMELAYKLQTPYKRFNQVKSALVKAHKPQVPYIVSQAQYTVPNKSDLKQVRIDQSSVRAPRRLGDVELYHDTKGFVVLHDNKKHVIEKCFMDSIARNITREQLKPFLKTGYFALNQTNDGTFTLNAHHRLRGGGPLFGKIMYWATKVTCYTVLMAATVGIVIGGGSIGVSVGAKGLKAAVVTAKTAKSAYAKASKKSNIKIATVMASNGAQSCLGYVGGMATVTEASGAAIFSTAGTAVGMAAPGILASGVVEAGGAPACAKVVGAGLAAGHSGTGIVAGIEFISLAVGIACGLTPTP